MRELFELVGRPHLFDIYCPTIRLCGPVVAAEVVVIAVVIVVFIHDGDVFEPFDGFDKSTSESQVTTVNSNIYGPS